MTGINTIRAKLILSYLASAAIALACIFIVFLSISVGFYHDFRRFTDWVDTHVIALMFIVISVFITLMSGFFILFTKKGINDLRKTTRFIDEISKGNLGIQISDDRNDELGNLSKAVNRMSRELKRLRDEEDRWEKEKDDLIGNISHDLRTPLTSIIGYLQLIAGRKENDISEDMIRYADIAYSKSLELKSLVEQLFEFANMSNRGLELNRTRVDITELVRQVILDQMPAANEHNIRFRLSVPDEKIYVSADPELIARVFDNLIGNAVKYGAGGEKVDIVVAKEDGLVSIKITNYGTEIAREDLPRVFDRFFRGDRSRSGGSAGAGLGLAIVKSIIEKHNGEVSADSDNNGTTFTVRLETAL